MDTKNDPTDLTREQLNRQDFVDNEIHYLLNLLNPSQTKIEWDIEMISSIRDNISHWLVEVLAVTDEQTFYPYFKDDVEY